MTAYRIIIPEEHCQIVEFRQEGFPGLAVINEALCNFEPKIVFAWHLSLMIELDNLASDGMPSKEEMDVIDPFGDTLDAVFEGDKSAKPNALFLAGITWNETREPIYCRLGRLLLSLISGIHPLVWRRYLRGTSVVPP